MSRPLLGRWVDLEAYHAVIDQSRATGAGFTLLLVMARHLNAQGECWASVPELAADCHVSDRAVQKIRARLVDEGELLPIESGGGSHHQTSGFRIVVAQVSKRSPVNESAPVNKTAATGEQTFTPPVSKRSPVPVNKRSPVSNRKVSKERNTEKERKGEGEKPAPPLKTSDPKMKKTDERLLWPAVQPVATQAVLDKHAEWWAQLLFQFHGHDAPDREVATQMLIAEGLSHVGSWVRFKGFESRPGDASFARSEFLKYMKHHDPAYAQAVEQTVQESLGPPVKAAARVAGRGS